MRPPQNYAERYQSDINRENSTDPLGEEYLRHVALRDFPEQASRSIV
jgi:hypothetical protein